MRITRIYADESGEPRFADAEIQMVSAPCFLTLPPFRMCAFSGNGDIRLFSTPPELRMHDFHTAPTRLFAVALSGTVEYETSDGEVRRQAPGSVVLVEDKRDGHITRFSEEQQFFLFIPVPDDLLATEIAGSSHRLGPNQVRLRSDDRACCQAWRGERPQAARVLTALQRTSPISWTK
jgi:hypothetical protein